MNGSASIVQQFLHGREALTREESARGFGVHTTRDYTALVDRLVFRLLRQVMAPGDEARDSTEGFAVLGTGSYGRRELCFGSDVDLMIIHADGLAQTTRKAIAQALYPIWDARLELGYTFLTADECLHLLHDDFSVLTALMDLRFLLGSPALYHSLERRIRKDLRRDPETLLNRFLVYQDKREKKYGRVDFFLEPEIKEGLGGLRDLHFMAWISRIFLNAGRLGRIKRIPDFSHFGLSQLMYSKGFLLRVRNHLHLLGGRREDRLLVPHQTEIARTLGYQDRPYSTGPERFMRNIYLHLNRVRYGREQFLAKALDILVPLPPEPSPKRVSRKFQVVKGNLVLKEGSLLDMDPLVVLQAFDEANRLGLFLGSGFIWEAREKLLYEGRTLASMPEAKALFLSLILNPKNPRIIRLALEIGLIGHFIPEFKRIRHLAQFGYYHVETVDLHALSTLQNLYDISKGVFEGPWRQFKKAFDALDDTRNLFLAGLIHDIGKGYRGNHSVKGAQIVPRILQRLGIDAEGIRTVSFLVENHLFLIDRSQKRDLNDEKTAVQVAQAIQQTSLLNQLFLLTVADCFATGPAASSEWRIMLLTELYSKVRRILEKGRLASPDATIRVRNRRRSLYRTLIRDFPKRNILALTEQASTRYFLNTPPKDMERHFRLALRLGEEKFKWSLEPLGRAPVTQVTLCTRDRPGLFSRMVGVFTSNNVQVLSASISTLKNGLAFDIYRVTNPVDPLREKEVWATIHREAEKAVVEGEEFDDDLEVRLRARMGSGHPGDPWIRTVRIDNDATDFFTCIEVYSTQRRGFLYLLAKKLFSLDLDIRFAKVQADQEKITGVFHVRDSRGQKIQDSARIEFIRTSLLSISS